MIPQGLSPQRYDKGKPVTIPATLLNKQVFQGEYLLLFMMTDYLSDLPQHRSPEEIRYSTFLKQGQRKRFYKCVTTCQGRLQTLACPSQCHVIIEAVVGNHKGFFSSRFPRPEEVLLEAGAPGLTWGRGFPASRPPRGLSFPRGAGVRCLGPLTPLCPRSGSMGKAAGFTARVCFSPSQ